MSAMYRLQLFDDPQSIYPVDVRLLDDGSLSLGRDPAADWTIADPECELSRSHCEISVQTEGLFIRPTGTNGVFDDRSGQRLPDHSETQLEVPCTLCLGRFRLAIGIAPQGENEGDTNGTMVLTPPLGASFHVPTDWADATPLAANEGGSLLEAFCRGAGLDSSQLSDEDPEAIMEQVGAVYRQMVLGLGDLMSERNRARARYEMNRTTIGGSGNNPFKWAPTQRLAIDLLKSGRESFLCGSDAVQASFGDIKRHLVATFAGLQGSLRAAVDSFAPAELEDAAGEGGSFLKNRAALQMQEVARRHEDLLRQLEAGEPGSLDRAFAAHYDAAERDQA